jgi:redox-sensitive bicupin YhaK (pirin superfamily)
MSAGTGVIHSEYNASETDTTHFLQIWIVPAARDLPPSYQQIAYAPSEKRGALRLMAGPDRHSNPPAAVINQDARMYAALLASGDTVRHDIPAGRHAWVQCVSGAIDVNGQRLAEGDGLAASDEAALSLRGAATGDAELLLFDLA